MPNESGNTVRENGNASLPRTWRLRHFVWFAAVVSGALVVGGGVLLVVAVVGQGTDWGQFGLGAALLVVGGLLAGVTAYLVRPQGTEAADHPVPEPGQEDWRWSSVKALVVASLVSSLVLALTVGLLILLAKNTNSGPEEALSLVFVAAAVVLILVVCTLTIVLKRLKLTDPREAMGLPRGSIRAVIALMLILLFFIAAIFLFNTTRRVPPSADELRTLQAVDAARLATIPTEQIRSQVTRVVNGTTVYDVTLLPSALDNQASDDLAKQLVTVLGTLVTAVAAFYFGANSVNAAWKGRAEGQSGQGVGAQGTDKAGPKTDDAKTTTDDVKPNTGGS